MMSGPATTATTVALTAGGISLLGVATGLHPTALIAGFCGGLFALSCNQEPMPVLRRISFTLVSSIAASYLAPLATAMLRAQDLIPPIITQEIVFPATAFLIGFLAHRVIGPAVLRMASKRTKEETQ